MQDRLYVRFQGVVRSRRGQFPGVFALANGLARGGELREDEYRFWRAGNDWYETAHPNPSTTDPTVYDHELHPGAVAWFKSTATHLIDRISGYLEILDAHGVACERIESPSPGLIIYEDDVQVVAVPFERLPVTAVQQRSTPTTGTAAGRPEAQATG